MTKLVDYHYGTIFVSKETGLEWIFVCQHPDGDVSLIRREPGAATSRMFVRPRRLKNDYIVKK